MTTVELPRTPDLLGLYARAARGALPTGSPNGVPAGSPVLPDTTVAVADVGVELDVVADYAGICGFPLASDAPVTSPHLLGFPLAVWLMTRDDFPFDVLGGIHVANRIVAHEPIPIGSRVDVTARLDGLRPHRRGWLFDAVVEVRRDGRLAWESASANLCPTGSPDPGEVDQGEAGAPDGPADHADGSRTAEDVDPAALPLTGRWRVPADVGRRYGAVSGDRNPIHLSAVSAKPFGFPRAIAHGMWSLARAVAGLGRLDLPVAIDVVFRKPVLLPSTVTYATRREQDGWTFALRRPDGRPHLAGTVTPA